MDAPNPQLTAPGDASGQNTLIPEELRCPPHPLLPNLTDDQVAQWLSKPDGPQKYADWLAKRTEQAKLWDPEEPDADLFHTGYIPAMWERARKLLDETYLLVVFGGNGSAKTWFAAWLAMRLMTQRRGYKVLFLHEAEKPCIDVYHAAVYAWMPRSQRGIRRGHITNTEYTVKNGFPNGRFVLPNRSIGVFGYYGQDPKDYEGGGWDLICADENLPIRWLRTLMYRLPRKNGRFIWTYTCIKGITPTIREVVSDATLVEERRAPLLPANHTTKDLEKAGCSPGCVPVVQHGLRYKSRIIYFFTEDNPFSGYEQQAEQAAGAPIEEIERRFYGWARDTKGRMFPNFGPHNIIEPEEVPDKGTNSHVVDPVLEGPRNWFMLWIRIGADKKHRVYREWPDVPNYGEWAVPTERNPEAGGLGWDGDPGPAQAKIGHGYREYKILILQLERHGEGDKKTQETIIWRLFDPRASGTELMTKDGGTTLIYEMATEDVDPETGDKVPGLEFEQALKVRDDDPIVILDSWLKGPNPQLLVSSACQNLIWALQNWTGKDGRKGACKDPIDCLKYYVTSGASFGSEECKSTGGGSY